MPKSQEAFSELGITKTEGNILESLIAEGPGTGSAVAARLGMHKSVAYFTLEQLIGKGLASFIVVNKRREYRPLEPEMLRLRLEERKKLFMNNFGQIQALLQATRQKKKRPMFSIFEGWEGMRMAFDDILATKPEEYFVFGVDVPEKILPRFRRFIKQFHLKRAAKGIKCEMLVSSKLRSTIGADRRNEKNTSVRFISSEYSMPMAVNAYGDKILFAVWTDPPLALIVENKEVSQSFRAFFRLLWRIGKP